MLGELTKTGIDLKTIRKKVACQTKIIAFKRKIQLNLNGIDLKIIRKKADHLMQKALHLNENLN